MRHRSRSSNNLTSFPILESVQGWNSSDPEDTYYSYRNSSVYSGKLRYSSSDMFDVNSGRKRRASSVLVPNPCVHLSVKSNPIGTTLHIDGTVGSSVLLRDYEGPEGTPYFILSPSRDLGVYPAALGVGNDFTATDWVSLSSNFFEAYDSFVSPQLLVGEDIVEHQVFKEAFLTVLNPTRAVRNFVKLLKPFNIRGKTPLGAVVDIARGASSQVLSYNFAIKPAIKDTISALGAHKFVKERLLYLRQNRGQYVRVGALQKAAATVTPFDPEPFPATSYLYASLKHKFRESRITGWARVRDDINHVGDWAAYAQYFGIQHVVGLAWELIPYSFLVDWVTNAQERIRNITRLRFGGPFSELTGLSCSEKTFEIVDIYATPGVVLGIGGKLLGPKSTLLGHRTSTSYTRALFPPETSSFLTIPELKSFQLITGSALLIKNLTS